MFADDVEREDLRHLESPLGGTARTTATITAVCEGHDNDRDDYCDVEADGGAVPLIVAARL